MPVKPKQIEGKWRVVDPDGEIATNRVGTPVDGGGHESRDGAMAQSMAINANMKKAKRKR